MEKYETSRIPRENLKKTNPNQYTSFWTSLTLTYAVRTATAQISRSRKGGKSGWDPWNWRNNRMDPRLKSIMKRLEDVDKILPVASGKSEVGKSIVASTTALISSDRDHDVGLLDLDLQRASAHVILGSSNFDFPEKEKEVILPRSERYQLHVRGPLL